MRKYLAWLFMVWFCPSVALCGSSTSEGTQGVPAKATLTLAQNGQPAATIVVARKPTRAAQFAAYELQWHLKQITGGDFRIAPRTSPSRD